MFGVGTLGLLGGIGGNVGPSFDPAAAAFFARIPAQTDARYALLNTVFADLRSAGILSLIDCLWLMAAADSTTARTNLISSSFTLTPVASPAFTVDRGYTGDGASAALNTNFNPVTAGGKYSQNSAHAFFYDRLNVGSTTNIAMAAFLTGGSPQIIKQPAGPIVFYRINDSGVAAPHATPLGMYLADRSGSVSKALYINGVSAATDVSTASVAPNSIAVALLAQNSGTLSAFSTDNLAAAGLGGSLGALAPQYYSIIQAYMTGVGAQV